jgi:TatD DNase family protein
MISLIDTHCHIQSIGANRGERGTLELWSKLTDRTANDVINDAKDAGVAKLICVGCDVSDSELATEFVESKDNCYASVGIHPHEAKEYIGNASELEKLKTLVKRDKVIAVGECGLDYFYLHSTKEDQEKILRYQLELAKDTNLPVIFHVRDAFDDFWKVFEDYKGIKGVLHSYTDSLENMQKALDLGLYIGVNGIVTFTKSPEQLETYRQIPMPRLLLETDAPYLTPAPYRGSINEPKRVRRVAEFLSEMRHEDLSVLSTATTNNGKVLFGI